MSLSERLGEAAQARATAPAPLQLLELTGGRLDVVGIDVTEGRAAIDLRITGVVGQAAPAPAPAAPVPAPAAAAPTPSDPAHTTPATAPASAPTLAPRPAADIATPAARGAAPASRFALRRNRLERREAKLAQQRPTPPPDVEAPPCPRCGAPSRVDINDRTRGVMHCSCDSCLKMWQVQVAAPPAPFA